MRYGYQPQRNGEAVFYGVRKNRDARPLMLLEPGEIQPLELDFTNYVDGVETLSSLTVSTQNLTAVAGGSGLRRSILITGPDIEGYATVTATFSTGAKWVEEFCIRNKVREGSPDLAYSDYSRYGTA